MKNIVATAVFVKNHKVLLEKRRTDEDNYAGLWAFPGGHKEKTETIEETLCREMKEELKIKILNYRLIGVFEDIDPTSKQLYQHNAFLCTKWIGEIKETTEEAGLKWIEIDKVEKLEHASKTTLNIIKKIKSRLK